MLFAGCGNGESRTSATRCNEAEKLIRPRSFTRADDAAARLRNLIKAEEQTLAAVHEDDPLSPQLVAAIARARRTLAAVAVDPLQSTSMSPSATVVPATRRAIDEAWSLIGSYCGRHRPD